MLGQKRTQPITHETVVYWKIDTGGQVDAELVVRAIEKYRDRLTNPHHKALQKGLVEAMTNSRQHAYTSDVSVRNWWMFSQLKDGRLTVGLCDLGMGIPRSLREDKTGLLASIMAWLVEAKRGASDANLIRGAMAVGVSRTKLAHRGKGLRDMRRVLDGLKGKLNIHSGRGFYEYEAATGDETCKDFKKSMAIEGTLVSWHIPLAQEVLPL